MIVHKSFIIATAVCWAVPALAQDPAGCDKFKWPVDRERAALNTPGLGKLASGSELTALPTTARLGLRPTAEAALPLTPERKPKDGTFAGFVALKSPVEAGVYTVSLSDYAWLDVVQNGRMLKPVAFSGVTGCESIRKVVKFELSNVPVLVQVSGVAADSILIALMPARD